MWLGFVSDSYHSFTCSFGIPYQASKQKKTNLKMWSKVLIILREYAIRHWIKLKNEFLPKEHESILTSNYLSHSSNNAGSLNARPPKKLLTSNFFFFKFYWSVVDLQCCDNFCCPTRWFSYTCTTFILFKILFPYRLSQNIG